MEANGRPVTAWLGDIVNLERMLIVLTIASYATVLYTYLGYPALLWLLSRFVPHRALPHGEPRMWPDVSILVAAYNEEQVIGDRLCNLAALHYPAARVEILVGSDGSTDRTCEIVAANPDPRIRLLAFPDRRGKASVLNDLVAAARGDVVVLTDANTYFFPDAVRELVATLERRPTTCAVVGRVDIHSSVAAGNLDGAYWAYETWIKTLESRFGSVLGANGSIYAFRRARFQPIPPEAIVDDFLIPMLMRLRVAGEVVFLPAARAWEASPARVVDEFRRRVRIGAGDLQALTWTWQLLLPWKGMVAFSYFSHKVLRWLVPFLLLIGFGATLGLLHRPVFRLLFFGQLLVFGMGLGAPLVRRIPVLGVAAAAARYFFVLNAAILLGFVHLVLGLARPAWRTTPRSSARLPPDPLQRRRGVVP
jgi:cellulose synthase/poly-beta-1,6-N-acetylglucosamine synthase-like glycosyltransferase